MTEITDDAIDVAEDYLSKGKRQADSALETAREYGSAFEDQISTNPLTAVLVALGIGCLVGFLVRGR